MGLTPSREKKSDVTASASSCSASPLPVRLKPVVRAMAMAENVWLSCCQSRKFGYEMEPFGKFGLLASSLTSCSGCGKGSGFQRTPSTTEKSAVLAPMPIARVSTAMALKAGWLRSMRRP